MQDEGMQPEIWFEYERGTVTIRETAPTLFVLSWYPRRPDNPTWHLNSFRAEMSSRQCSRNAAMLLLMAVDAAGSPRHRLLKP